MFRSLSKERKLITQNSIHTTHIRDLAELMAARDSCPHRLWHALRQPSMMRGGPIDSDHSHASRARQVAAGLEEEIAEVYPALHNAFEVSGSRSGARLKGRPDIITRTADGDVTVYEVPDEEPALADELVVKLAMYLLPRSNAGRWRGSSPAGCVIYPDGSEKRIEVDAIDDTFAESVASVMRQLVSDDPAPRVPSADECGRCPLTAEACRDRVDVEAGRITKGRQSNLHDAC